MSIEGVKISCHKISQKVLLNQGDQYLQIILKEEINKLTQKIESCWDENNPGDVRSFDERLKQKLTPEEYELITSWR